jgi:hypothetical protein
LYLRCAKFFAARRIKRFSQGVFTRGEGADG